MNAKHGKILAVSSGVVLCGAFVAFAVTAPPEAKEVPLPSTTITETIHVPHGVPVPGPTKTVEVPGPTVTATRTVSVTRSLERKPATPVVPQGSARSQAQAIFGSQFSCIDSIISHESGWSVTATNPSSGAYGLGQALPGSKMAPYGSDWRYSANTQLRWLKSYVDGRYGGACGAWSFWQSHNWY